eukprot:COSAG01_NODE_7006_length_3395_cov_4.820388_1_plen_643_part_00
MLLTSAAAVALFATSSSSPILLNIGSAKQLLFDDFVIAAMRGCERATRTLSPQVVLRPDAPWEAGFQLSASGGAVKERNGTVRLWYELHNASGSSQASGVPAVALSTDDGLTFSKPQLQLRPQGRFSTTNWLAGNSMHNCVQNVWLDPNTGLYHGTCEDTSSGEIALATSPDGLRWRDSARWNMQGNSDTRTQIFFDEWVSRYVMITRNWYFLPDFLHTHKPGPPTWALPSFRRVRRLEARSLRTQSPPLGVAPFTALELGACATAAQLRVLPRDGSAAWRQMFLGPGPDRAASCWGCPYTDECIAVERCSYQPHQRQSVGVQIPRASSDAGSPGQGCAGNGTFAATLMWALNGTAFVNTHSGLCMEAAPAPAAAGADDDDDPGSRGGGAPLTSVVQAPCDPDNTCQQWRADPLAGSLQLLHPAAAASAPLCLQMPDIPGHDGKPDGALNMHGGKLGQELPTNEPPAGGPWENQSIVLEADAHDNASYPNHSPPANRGNGAAVDYYGATVIPVRYGTEAAGGRVYIMLPMRFWHHSLPCGGLNPRTHQPQDGSQCLPAVFDIPVLASRDGLNFSWVTDARTPLVEPAASGGWNSNGLTYVLGEPHLTERGDELVIYLWGTNANHNGVRDACTCTYTCTQRPI